METSKQFSLDYRDLLKGLIVAVAGAVVAVVTASINAGDFNITFTAIWHGALIGGLGYLSKNFFTPSSTVSPNNPVAK